MVEKEMFLVVVHLVEGRNFPKRPHHEIVADIKFNGESLDSTPTAHTDSPQFVQELCWEMDKKGLQQHRLQRSAIKVQLFAVDTRSKTREQVGYIMLQIRSALEKKAFRWHKVLSPKYKETCPEVKLGLYIEDDKGPQEISFKAKPAPPSTPLNPKALQPVLNEAENYYQIGPAQQCKEMFRFSVTISLANNLALLIPTNKTLHGSEYCFYYSLLGNEIRTIPFPDLVDAKFVAERCTVKLRSSIKALRQFLVNQPGLEVHLVCGEQSLGSCQISLASLLKEGSTEIYMKPVTIEGAFILTPPSKSKNLTPRMSELEQQPAVGVFIELAEENLPTADQEYQDEAASTPEKKSSPPPKPKKEKPKAKAKTKPKQKGKGKPKVQEPKLDLRPVRDTPEPSYNGNYSETFESLKSEQESGREDNSLGDGEKETATKETKTQEDSRKPSPRQQQQQQQQQQPQQQQQQQQQQPQQQSNVNFIPNHPSQNQAQSHSHPRLQQGIPQGPSPINMLTGDGNVTDPHHFSASVDTRSIKHINLPQGANIFVRYSYPFFGIQGPVFTDPPVRVAPHSEVQLAQSHCSFDFASTFQTVYQMYTRNPLILEVWSAEKEENVMIGHAQFPLISVVHREKIRVAHKSGVHGWRQSINERVLIYPTSPNPDAQQPIGELHVHFTMEDWGLLDPKILPGNQQQGMEGGARSARSSSPLNRREDVVVSPRQTKEYQVALELEEWKEREELKFKKQLKAKEDQLMAAMASEWRQKSVASEVVRRKEKAEVEKLMDTLTKKLEDLGRREKQVAAKEQESEQYRQDLEREHQRKMIEMQEASRRMKEDCDHKLHLQDMKTKEYEEYIHKLKGNLSEEEAKYKQLEADFIRYKQQENCKPEVRLQAEINLLTLEKVELERKLESANRSRHKLQDHSKMLTQQLINVREKEKKEKVAQIKQKDNELEHMRLRQLAAEEQKTIQQMEKPQLEGVKQDLANLQENMRLANESKSTGGLAAQHSTYGITAGGDFGSTRDDEHIVRLIEERDQLMKSGYRTDDLVISEMDREIREAIARKGNTSASGAAMLTNY